MITFTQNDSHGQLYAECSQSGKDYRIPTNKVEEFLSEVGLTLDKLLSGPQQSAANIQDALTKYDG